MLHDVFIGYDRRDREVAERIEEALERADLEVWRDRPRLQPGDDFSDEIRGAIRGSRLGLCLIGRDWGSAWCRDELACIDNSDCRLYPVRLPGAPPLEGPYANLDAPVLFEDIESIEALVEKVREKLESPGAGGNTSRRRRLGRDFGPYLRELHGRLTPLQLKTIADKADVLPLAAVYTGLRVAHTRERDEEPEEGMASRVLDLRREHDREGVSALQLLAGHSRVVLLGDPGGGKSTLARYLGLCMAGEALREAPRLTDLLARHRTEQQSSGEGHAAFAEDDPAPQDEPEWPHGALLPLFVELRRFADSAAFPSTNDGPSADAILDFVAGQHDGVSAPELRAWLTAGEASNALLVLDGLDEVAHATDRLATLAACVGAFALQYPACRILVTARPYAYADAQQTGLGLERSGFVVSRLLPFDEPAGRAFVRGWYGCLVEQGTAGLDAERARERAAALIARLGDRDLAPLARSPLLLTLLASLHATGEGTFERGRTGLYQRYSGLLLDDWNEAKPGGETLTDEMGMDKGQIRHALEQLACDVHGDSPDPDGAVISPGRVLETLRQHRSGAKGVPLGDILDHLHLRSGILVGDRPGELRFPHRSFQEYLAACHLSEDDEFPRAVLERYRTDPVRWREVLGWVASAAAVRMKRLLLADLLDGPDEARAWDAFGAGVVVREGDLAAKTDLREVRDARDRLAELLVEGGLDPLARSEAGRTLATLSDPRPGVGLTPTGVPDIEWIEVPAGSFVMGSDDTDEQAFGDEKPTREQTVDGFRVARYPITNAQYRPFARALAGGEGAEEALACFTQAGREWLDSADRARPDPRFPFHLDNHPVIGASWFEAVAFCRWLSERLGHEVRLPTEVEWERAARGVVRRVYPWGDEFDAEKANSLESGLGSTAPVGAFRNENPYGIEDMAGNVWEWCSTKWRGSYRETPDDALESAARRVVRGGSFLGDRRLVRCAFRFRGGPYGRGDLIGFRVVAPFSETLISEPSDL